MNFCKFILVRTLGRKLDDSPNKLCDIFSNEMDEKRVAGEARGNGRDADFCDGQGASGWAGAAQAAFGVA